MTEAQKRILYDSPKAARLMTVTGWVSSLGRFFGNDEDLARYNGSTHRVCPVDPSHGEHETRGYCDKCRSQKDRSRFAAMPKKAYADATFPITVFDGDDWFYREDELIDWLIDNGIAPEDAELVESVPEPFKGIVEDDVIDSFGAEDYELPVVVADAIDALNRLLEATPSGLYRKGNVAVTLPADFLKEPGHAG